MRKELRKFEFVAIGLVVSMMFVSIFSARAFASFAGDIYIRADGSVEPWNAPIATSDNVTYTLTANVPGTLTIERDNIVFDGTGHTLTGSGAGHGITLSGRSNVTVKDTTVENFYGNGNGIGIYLESSSSNTLSGNNLVNNWLGIFLSSSSGNTVSGNNAANNVYGICCYYSSDNNVLSGNTFTANQNGGIVIGASSNNNVVSGNNVANSIYAIEIHSSSSNNTVSANNATNSVAGIVLLYSSYNNVLSGNNITNNQQGILLSGSSGNTFFHNRLVNNAQQVSSDGSPNVWDDGYPSGGNYWSNYAGNDLYDGPFQNLPGSDGIGDTPYTIDGNNRDNYPWMAANYTVPYQITFDQTGVGDDFDGTVITVDGADYNRSGASFWWKAGSVHTFSYHFLLVASEDAKRYACMSVSGLSDRQNGNITIDSSGSVTGDYITQYFVAFTQTGSAAGSTIWYSVVGGFIGYVGVPFGTWLDYGMRLDYAYSTEVTGEEGVRYTLTGTVPESPQIITGNLTITGNYKTQYKVSFTQTGSAVAPSVSYSVDGGSVVVSTAPFDVWVDSGSNITYAYNVTVPGASGIQYTFTGVSPDSPQTVLSPFTVTGSYKTRFYLTVISTYGSPLGEGWYDADSTAYFNVSTPVSGGAGIQYACTGFTGNASGSGASGSVVMSGPAEVMFSWKTQYYLTVNSAYDSPFGAGWYDSGVTAGFNVSSPVSGGSGVQYLCTGYGGGASGSGASGSIIMNSSKTITFSWKTQYYVTFTQSGHAEIETYSAYGSEAWFSYTVDTNNSFVVLVVTGGYWNLMSVEPPAGFTPLVYTVGPDGLETVYIAVNPSQAAGTYQVHATSISWPSSLNIFSFATYIFAPGNYSFAVGSATGWPSASLTLPSGYGYYIFGGASGLRGSSFSVPADVRTLEWGYMLFSAIGHQASPSASVSATDWGVAIGGIAVRNLDLSTSTGSIVTVNGTELSCGDLPYSFWANSSDTISYNYSSIISSSSAGERFRLAGISAPPSPFTVVAPETIAGGYVTQYYLTVASSYDTPSGEGWYDSGTTANFSVSSPAAGDTGVRYACTGFTGNASGAGASGSISMSGPATITFGWKTQYYLTVSSAHDTPSGEDWYDSGSTAYASLSDWMVSGGSGIRYLFLTWSGDASGLGYLTSDPITMDGPKTATANWKTQYQVTFSQTGVDSSADSNTVLTVGVTTYAYNTLPTSVWEDSGTTFSWSSPVSGGSGKQFVQTGSSGSSPITAAGTYSATYKTQYQVSFTQTGISSDAGSNTVLTLGALTYAYNALPSGVWVDSGTTFNWESIVAGVSGERFAYTGDSGLVSPIVTWGLDAATYKTQYQHTITSSPAVGSGYVLVDSGAVTTPYTTPWWDSGSSHTIAANSPVTLSPGQSQYIYSSWSDAGAQSHSVSPTSVTIFTANFQLQYHLSVTGGNGPGGAGWYDSGSLAAPSSTWIWNTVSGQSRTALTNWQLDSVNQNPVRQNTGNLTLSVTMSTNHAVNFVSTTQYFLTVTGGYGISVSGSQTGDGWFDSGTSGSATSSHVWNSIPSQSRNNLYLWNLDGVSWYLVITRANSGTYTVPSPFMTNYHTINFVDTVQYFLTVTGGNGIVYGTPSPTSDNWYDSGSSTTVSSNWVWNIVSGQNRTTITNYAIDGIDQNPTRQDSGKLTTSSVSMSTYRTVAFASATQYFLTDTLISGSVNSITSSPTDDSWYDTGATVDVVLNYVWDASSSTRSNLFNYTVDGSTTNVPRAGSGTFAVPTITMNTAHSISDADVTQYYLTVTSAHDSPSGEGWYDTGETAHVSADQYVDIVSGSSRYRFDTWTGASGDYSDATVTMDSAKTVTANYAIQYLVTFSASGNLVSVTVPVDEWVLSSGSATGTFPLSVTNVAGNVRSDFVGDNRSATITEPTLIVGTYENYYFIAVSSAHDTATASGWVRGGLDFTASVTSPADIVSGDHQFVCTGYKVDGGALASGTMYTFSAVNSAHSIEFDWKEQYYIAFVVSPSGSGTTNQTDWYDAGQIWIVAKANSGYVFSQWFSSMASITFVSSTSTSTTASIGGSGTITATFQYSVTFTETGLPIGTSWGVTFNGVTQSSTASQIVFNNIAAGTYSWVVGTPVSRCTGTQYAASPPSGYMTVTAPTAQSIAFTKQYYLGMYTNYGTAIPGSGWFNAASKITISAMPPGTILGERYVWLGWIGLGSGSYIGTSNSASITMNGPIIELGFWAHQYLLTVRTTGVPSPYLTDVSLSGHDIGHASDASPFTTWITAGTSTGSIGVDSVVSGATGTRYVFTGWVGDGTANPRASMVMNGPITLTANYKTQYRVTFAQSGVGSDFTGPVVKVDGVNYARSGLSVSLWWDQNSQHTFQYLSPLTGTTYKYTLSSTTGTSSVGTAITQNGVTTITVTGQGTITGNYAKTKK